MLPSRIELKTVHASIRSKDLSSYSSCSAPATRSVASGSRRPACFARLIVAPQRQLYLNPSDAAATVGNSHDTKVAYPATRRLRIPSVGSLPNAHTAPAIMAALRSSSNIAGNPAS